VIQRHRPASWSLIGEGPLALAVRYRKAEEKAQRDLRIRERYPEAIIIYDETI